MLQEAFKEKGFYKTQCVISNMRRYHLKNNHYLTDIQQDKMTKIGKKFTTQSIIVAVHKGFFLILSPQAKQ